MSLASTGTEVYTATASFTTALLREGCEWPFGWFNTLHWDIVEHAVGFTPLRVVRYLAPFVLMYAQCFLLFEKGTRYTRLALGIACLSSMWSAWTTIRFTNPWYNMWNHVITMPYVHYMAKCLEFSALEGPLRDPRGRPRALAAWDLLINARMLGLGDVGLDVSSGIPNAKVPPGHVERFLATTLGPRPKSRIGSVARHAALAAACYIYVDFIFSLMPQLDPVFAQPYGGNGVLKAFVSRKFISFPGTLDIPIPTLLVKTAIGIAIPGIVFAAFEGLYQLFATVHVALGWRVADWDPNYFGGPHRADSLIDLWGTRWHQTFRHMFIVLTTAVLSALRIPVNGLSIFFGSFFFSGAIHVASEMAMNPVGSPGYLLLFFVLAGAGCTAEVLFKRITGHRVQGWLGSIWALSYMALVGGYVTHAWVDSGYTGCHAVKQGPGKFFADLVVKHALAVE